MQQDRSWVLPIAFVTFSGVMMGTVFLMLANQDLLLGPKATAVSGWLTLLVTAFGFGVTIYIVGMTARQVTQSNKQIDLKELEVYSNRISVMYDHIDLIKTSIIYAEKMQEAILGPLSIMTEGYYEKFIETLAEIRTATRSDVHGDITSFDDEYQSYNEESTNIQHAFYKIQIPFAGDNQAVFDEKEKVTKKYKNSSFALLRKINERRNDLIRKREFITQKHFKI